MSERPEHTAEYAWIPRWLREPSPLHDDMRLIDLLPFMGFLLLAALLIVFVWRSEWLFLLLIPGSLGLAWCRRHIPDAAQNDCSGAGE